jgi:hypothetical protein
MQSFFQRAIVQFGNALSNVATIVTDSDAYEDLLNSLGWPSTAMPNQFADLLPSTQRLQSLIAASATSPSYADLLAIVQETQTFYAAVEGLTQIPRDVSDSGFLEHFKQELVHFLVIEGLRTQSQALYQMLGMLRFIQQVPVLQTSTRQAYTQERLDLQNLAGFIKQPIDYLQDVFGSNGDIDLPDELLLQVMDLLQALGLTAGLASAETPLLLGQNNAEGDAPPNLALQLSFLNKLLPAVAGSPLEVWLSRYSYLSDPLPEDGADYGQSGLLLRLTKGADAPIDLPIGEYLHLEVPAFGNAQQALEVRVSLHDFGVSYPGVSAAQAAFTGQEIMALRYTPDEPLLLLGGADKTRLEAAGLRLALALNTTVGQEDITFTISLLSSEMVLASAEGDSFLSSVLPAQSRVSVPFAIAVSTSKGFSFNGSPRTSTFNLRTLTVGPAKLLGTRLGLSAVNNKLTLAATANFCVTLGPVQAAFTEIGVAFGVRIEDEKISPEFGFSPPNGLAIDVASDLVTGGGYLFLDAANHKYAGAATLTLQTGSRDINLNALGLLQTQLPTNPDAYSLLLLITASFAPIQLGLGFTLNGVGGLVGVNRAANTDLLRGLVRSGGLSQLLFPANVLDNPAGALALVDAAFPATEGRYLIGLLGQLGWGVPTSIITLDVALLVELPAPVRLVLLGVLQAMLPSQHNDVLKLRADFLGTVDFGARKAAFDAALSDSHLLQFALTGDLAFRLYQGSNPVFLITAGGFHPAFQPPAGAELPSLRRLTLALSQGDELQLSLASYFAVTSNTVQFGAHLDLYLRLRLGLHVDGHFGFDVLFQFNPFQVLAHVEAGVAIKRGNSELLGLHLALDVSGPGPWHVWGEASFRLWFVKIRVGVDATLGSKAAPQPIAAPKVHELLSAALQAPASWEVAAPSTSTPSGVVLRPAASQAGKLFLDPRGSLALRQRVVPLGVTIDKYGSGPAKPQGGQRFDVTSLWVGEQAYAGEGVEVVSDFFAPDQFRRLSEAQKLSLPSFQLLPSGWRLKSLAGLQGAATATRRVVAYEQLLVEGPNTGTASGGATSAGMRKLSAASFRQLARNGALGQAYQATQPSARAPRPVGWSEDTYALVNAADLSLYQGQNHFGSQVEAEQYRVAQHDATELLVVPTYQLELA